MDPTDLAAVEQQAFALSSACSDHHYHHGWSIAVKGQPIAFLNIQQVLDGAEILRIALVPD